MSDFAPAYFGVIAIIGIFWYQGMSLHNRLEVVRRKKIVSSSFSPNISSFLGHRYRFRWNRPIFKGEVLSFVLSLFFFVIQNAYISDCTFEAKNIHVREQILKDINLNIVLLRTSIVQRSDQINPLTGYS